jgi:hypothetical protein
MDRLDGVRYIGYQILDGFNKFNKFNWKQPFEPFEPFEPFAPLKPSVHFKQKLS